jgi:hypothetical protein
MKQFVKSAITEAFQITSIEDVGDYKKLCNKQDGSWALVGVNRFRLHGIEVGMYYCCNEYGDVKFLSSDDFERMYILYPFLDKTEER